MTGVPALPTVSVVVCTRNRTELLRRCLGAIRQIDSPIHEVVVIDNASDSPDVADIVRRHGFRYVLEPAIGVSRARNAGLRSALGDIVACIDDDAYPDRAWISALLPEFSDPAVGAVVGRTIPRSDAAGEDLAVILSDLDGGPVRRVIDTSTPSWFVLTNFGGVGAGANMAFRRSFIDSWGGFDERIGYGTPIPGLEEHNAFFRIVSSGHRLVYTPDSVVYHPITHLQKEGLKRRRSRIASSIAYTLILMEEHPSHRRELWRFLVSGVRRSERDWRWQPATVPRVTRLALVSAVGPAVTRYLRARSGGTRRP